MKNRLKVLLAEKFGSAARVPSQEEIADAIGVSQTTVSRWLANKIDRYDSSTVTALCKYLNVDVQELLYIDWQAEEN